jgi:hypothetical protein
MYSVTITSSGLAVRRAVEALLWIQTLEGPLKGPAICDETGMVWTTQLANTILHKLLESLFTINQKLFPKRINSLGKIRELYHVFCLFRRGSDSCALSEDVSISDVNVVN